jgi:UDP:flavonoid glycosyltransferase YjiC (YdhE family)
VSVVFVCLDSRGGVEPYLAVAATMRAWGVDAVLVAPENFRYLITGRGVPMRPLTGDFAGLRHGVGDLIGSRWGQRRLLREVGGDLNHRVRVWMRQTHRACQDAEVIVTGAGGRPLAAAAAEARAVPLVTAYLQPLGAPTTRYPGVYAPHAPGWLGGPGRYLSGVYSDLAASLPTLAAVRRARRTVLNLAARPAPRRPAAPVLYGYSRHVLPPPPSWASTHRFVTGYWTLPADPSWCPPPGLVEFLHAGPPPVCLGLGSTPGRDPDGRIALFIAAAHAARVRAVILTGPSRRTRPDRVLGDDVYLTAAAPHSWLYPQVSAVVHHGGAGTTGSGLRAGLPTQILPHRADQSFWAARVHALGVGPPAIPRRRLTVDRLATALRVLTRDWRMRERAADLGALICEEDGVGDAVGEIVRVRDQHRSTR